MTSCFRHRKTGGFSLLPVICQRSPGFLWKHGMVSQWMVNQWIACRCS